MFDRVRCTEISGRFSRSAVADANEVKLVNQFEELK
jgi:hypothetical protein